MLFVVCSVLIRFCVIDIIILIDNDVVLVMISSIYLFVKFEDVLSMFDVVSICIFFIDNLLICGSIIFNVFVCMVKFFGRR